MGRGAHGGLPMETAPAMHTRSCVCARGHVWAHAHFTGGLERFTELPRPRPAGLTRVPTPRSLGSLLLSPPRWRVLTLSVARQAASPGSRRPRETRVRKQIIAARGALQAHAPRHWGLSIAWCRRVGCTLGPSSSSSWARLTRALKQMNECERIPLWPGGIAVGSLGVSTLYAHRGDTLCRGELVLI